MAGMRKLLLTDVLLLCSSCYGLPPPSVAREPPKRLRRAFNELLPRATYSICNFDRRILAQSAIGGAAVCPSRQASYGSGDTAPRNSA